MVSVMPSFITGPAMSFNQQQREEDERHAQYWAQYAAYQSVSQPVNPALHIPVLPSQPAWNERFSVAAYPQANFYEEPQSLYGPADYLVHHPHTPALPISQPPSYQSQPALGFSTSQLSYTSEPAASSFSNSGPQRHVRTVSHDSYASFTSTQAPSPEASESNYSRSSSPGSADMSQYGYLNTNGTWRCNYPGCTSRAVFTRGCDLRKHHKRHTKSFFCRYPSCSQSTGGGFSSKKDLARHEAKHNPGVVCEWEGCDRVFSRVDNMRDHVKRIHLKAAKRAAASRTQPSSCQE